MLLDLTLVNVNDLHGISFMALANFFGQRTFAL